MEGREPMLMGVLLRFPMTWSAATLVGAQAAVSLRSPRLSPNHSTGVKLPDDFVVTPLQYVG
jgi:hypothetical protein